MKHANIIAISGASILLTLTALGAVANSPDSEIYKRQTELCLAEAGSTADRADCYISGYTSAMMSIKLWNETLTEKFPAGFAPWQQSVQLWSQYRENEDAVIEEVFTPGGNPRLTVGGAKSVYILAMARLELLELYNAGLGKQSE